MKKMTEYIVAGVKADNEEVFMKRIGEILERKGLLEFLTDGVPVGVRVIDDEALIKYINKDRSNKALDIESIKIDGDFQIKIEYKYLSSTQYFKNVEDKDYWEGGGYRSDLSKSEKPTEEYTIKGVRYSTTYVSYHADNDIPGVEYWRV